MTKRAFGELELAILQIFRSSQQMTVGDVHKALGGKDKYTTVMTVMNRLVEKKQLERERQGLRYTYWMLEAKSHLKKRLSGLRMSEVVNYLIDASDEVSDEELAELESMIEQAKQKLKGAS